MTRGPGRLCIALLLAACGDGGTGGARPGLDAGVRPPGDAEAADGAAPGRVDARPPDARRVDAGPSDARPAADARPVPLDAARPTDGAHADAASLLVDAGGRPLDALAADAAPPAPDAGDPPGPVPDAAPDVMPDAAPPPADAALPDALPDANLPEVVCDGLDEDADGLPDDGFECALGATDRCETRCGSLGYRTCIDGCRYTECVPPRERCNGVDDNCDGAADEGMPCVPGQTRPCRRGCGPEGVELCTDACVWRACNAPEVSCDPACLADPDRCRAPYTHCDLDADLDGRLDPGAIEVAPHNLMSFTNPRHYSQFYWDTADAGEQVVAGWYELDENDPNRRWGVLQEFDGEGRPTHRTVRMPAIDMLWAFGWAIEITPEHVIAIAYGWDVEFTEYAYWYILDRDLNLLSGPHEWGGSPFSGDHRPYYHGWPCGEHLWCWDAFYFPPVFPTSAIPMVQILNLETFELTNQIAPEGTPMPPGWFFGARLPGASGRLKIATPWLSDQSFWTYHYYSVLGYEPWRTLVGESETREIYPEVAQNWLTFGRGDPFDVEGSVRIGEGLAAIGPNSDLTVDGHPIARAFVDSVNGWRYFAQKSVLTASEAIILEEGVGNPLVYQGAYLLLSHPKAADDYPPDHIGELHPDGERTIWQTRQPGDSGLRRIETQVIGGPVWEDDASGQVWLRRIRCTRERIIAHAP